MALDMASTPMDLSIVIPALDERENLTRLIPALQELARSMHIAAQIVVVDGPSRDGTAEAATSLGAAVVKQREPGYGGALMAGFAAARAPFVITMDADLSHPAAFVRDLWARRNDAEILIASRYVGGGAATVGLVRRILSVILNSVYRLALSLPVRDLSSGFRLYRRDALLGLHLESRDFDVLEEILVLGYNQGWRILEIPFHYMPRASGVSHAKLIQFGRAYLRTLVKMRRLRNTSVPNSGLVGRRTKA